MTIADFAEKLWNLKLEEYEKVQINNGFEKYKKNPKYYESFYINYPKEQNNKSLLYLYSVFKNCKESED